jgi:hypothetical protein
MKVLKLQKLLFGLALVSIMSAISLHTAYGQEAIADAKTKPVKVEYKDGGKVVPDKTLYLVYYHPAKKEWVESKATTNKKGIAIFKVHFATCSFYYATSESDLNKKRKLDKNDDKLRLFTVPDDTTSIDVSINKSGDISIVWSKK